MNDVSVPVELVAYIPLIATVLQLAKSIPAIVKIKEWLPVLSVGAGVLIAFIAMPSGVENAVKIVGGLVLGVAASGLYSGIKAVGGVVSNG